MGIPFFVDQAYLCEGPAKVDPQNQLTAHSIIVNLNPSKIHKSM